MRFSLVVLLMLFLLLAAWGLVLASTDSAKTVYEAKCKMCHGSDGKAGTKAGEMMKVPDLTVPSSWKHGTSQEDVEKIISRGEGKMPKYEGKLSPEEITSVATYMRDLCGVAGN